MEHWVEEMEGWDERPFSGGYAGLHDLATDDFSGAVSTGDAWLFMVSGQVVAIVERLQTNEGTVATDADVERFEGADGTAYAAPHPSVPLLVAMKSADGETRGKYYTEKTPVDEVAATLEEGGFTGYVELSENVLSGDYFTVYQGGQATDLAYLGNARRLLTGEDAHERMADEVGIYEVVAVDLDVAEIPGSGSDAGGAAAGAGAGGEGAGAGAGGEAAGAAGDGAGGSGATGDAGSVGRTNDHRGVRSIDEPDRTIVDEGGPDAAESESAGTEPADGQETTPTAQSSGEPASEGSMAEKPAEASPGAEAGVAGATSGSRDETPSVTERIATRAVPSVDPGRSGMGESEESRPGPGAVAGDEGDGRAAPAATAATRPSDADDTVDPADAQDREADDPDADPAALDVLREEVRVAREQLAITKRERDELAARVEELESRLADRNNGGATRDETEGPSLDVAEAYAGTNLFVRYGSKGKLTLDDAHRGDGDVEELRMNLRLEHHTTFEESDATVDGRPFREWLEATQQFRFAHWLVTTLLFEIRETGAVEGMRDLYDALPELDRVEFDGTVSVTEDGDDDEVTFGLVGRDQMGDPLVVAEFESTREPVGETAMADLVTDATATAGSHDTLAGAFHVTAAFYEPSALETAREATSGSLLSRDRRRSFVKRSRSAGYHLALVESRDGSFHLSVPDL